MRGNRRQFLGACAAAASGLSGAAEGSAAVRNRIAMGVIEHSYSLRKVQDRARFSDPIAFLDFCHERDAGGLQMVIGRRDSDYGDRLRSKVAADGMYLEGSIALPRNEAQAETFEAEVKGAAAAGVRIFRTAMLSGRRYETFKTAEAFREFAQQAEKSLHLAKPVVERCGVKLAVENHKDWRLSEMIPILERLDSKSIGVNLDTGNNIALLEDPMEVVEKLAPWSFSTHLKDMGIEPYEDGFLMSEVPLGEGFLDIQRIVKVIRDARPEIHFNLEMITRDPLKIPCLTQGYWATFADLPGRDLARTLTMVRTHATKKPLPRVGQLSIEERLKVEDDNVRRSLAYAREHLGL